MPILNYMNKGLGQKPLGLFPQMPGGLPQGGAQMGPQGTNLAPKAAFLQLLMQRRGGRSARGGLFSTNRLIGGNLGGWLEALYASMQPKPAPPQYQPPAWWNY